MAAVGGQIVGDADSRVCGAGGEIAGEDVEPTPPARRRRRRTARQQLVSKSEFKTWLLFSADGLRPGQAMDICDDKLGNIELQGVVLGQWSLERADLQRWDDFRLSELVRGRVGQAARAARANVYPCLFSAN